MREWDFAVKRPRMTSNKADKEEQEKFIDDFQTYMVFLFIVCNVYGLKLKLLFTDEVSLRRDGTIHFGWYKKGTTPEIPESNGRFQSIKMIGAVDQQEGSFHLHKVKGKVTLQVYADFLAYLANIHKDKVLVIVHDNAPWHGVKSLNGLLKEKGVKNILVIRLPKYSPQMNPSENLWKWMRESVTHCRYYEDLNELTNSVWKFYRRAYNQRESARKRFKTEMPLFNIFVKNYSKGIKLALLFLNCNKKLYY